MTERIVVGVDDSAGGRAALEHALREGAIRGVEVDVIGTYALPDFWPGQAVPGWSMGPSADEIRDEVFKQVERIVAKARADLGDAGATVVRVHAVGGNAAAVLLDAARRAQLLVVGSRGHGGFASMVLGSVSLQCVLHAPCPVTVVPAPVASGTVHDDRVAAAAD